MKIHTYLNQRFIITVTKFRLQVSKEYSLTLIVIKKIILLNFHICSEHFMNTLHTSKNVPFTLTSHETSSLCTYGYIDNLNFYIVISPVRLDLSIILVLFESVYVTWGMSLWTNRSFEIEFQINDVLLLLTTVWLNFSIISTV